MNRVTPMPALPATMTVVAAPEPDAATASTTRASSASRPMNLRLTTRPGMGRIVGARIDRPGPVPGPGTLPR